jgi:hypothetical protein
MADFFFESWPNGAGPSIIQFVLVIAGAFAGVRAIDDVKAWMTARAEARSDVPKTPSF